MKISRQNYNDVTVIELQGNLDLDNVDQLQDVVAEVISEHKSGIVLDLSNVGFVDGKALETLLWTRDYCDQNSCQLRLAGLEENCAKILEVTRLDGVFDCYTELAEAVKSFA